MSKKKKFALDVPRKEAMKILKEARQKRMKLLKIWHSNRGDSSFCVGPIEKYENGEFSVWINPFDEFEGLGIDLDKIRLSAEVALKNALALRDYCGWCNLTELELFCIEGKGPLLQRAMLDYGFRPSKRNPDQWVRITSKDKKEEDIFF